MSSTSDDIQFKLGEHVVVAEGKFKSDYGESIKNNIRLYARNFRIESIGHTSNGIRKTIRIKKTYMLY